MRVFDLHCDTLTECFINKSELLNDNMSVSLGYAREGFGWCQTFAVFVPDTLRGLDAARYFDLNYAFFTRQMEKYASLAAQAMSARDIFGIIESGRCAALLSIEGGSAIGPDLARIEKLARIGVKLIGLTWNGENELGGGFGYGGGLKPFGAEAVAEMERCGIAADVSHLNDKGFEDMLKISRRPFIASHSNARAVRNHARNLADEHIAEIIRRGGLIGLNFCADFLDYEPGGSYRELIAHARHILELGGENVLALGSDFDGARIGEEIGNPGKMSFLYGEMLKSGIPGAIIEKIFFDNAHDFFIRYEAARKGFGF